MKKAAIDLKTPLGPLVRCPDCNAFDVAISKSGTYICDECSASFEFDGDLSKDTVPTEVRAEMDAAKVHNDKLRSAK